VSKKRPRVKITGPGCGEGGQIILGEGADCIIRQPIEMSTVCNGTVLEHNEVLTWTIRILKEGEV